MSNDALSTVTSAVPLHPGSRSCCILAWNMKELMAVADISKYQQLQLAAKTNANARSWQLSLRHRGERCSRQVQECHVPDQKTSDGAARGTSNAPNHHTDKLIQERMIQRVRNTSFGQSTAAKTTKCLTMSVTVLANFW